MKRIVSLSLMCFAMICACQKQDSATEAQLAQQKTELDTREKALAEREKGLAEKEKMIARFRAIPSDLQARKPAVDPEQAKAEREKRIQQLPPELQALIPDRSLLDARRTEKSTTTVDPEQAKAERERRIQQLPPELQALIRDRSLLDSRSEKATEDRTAELKRRLEEARTKKMGAIASPNAETSDAQSISPAPSPTPE